MDMGMQKPLDTARSSVTAMDLAGRSLAPARLREAQPAGAAEAPVAAQSRDAVQQPQEVPREQLEAAVSDMQDFVQSVQRNINFRVDDDSGRVVVNVTERDSGEVIRQIPSEEALRLAENLAEIRSLLFTAEA